MQHRSGLLKTFKNGTRWWAFIFHGWYFLFKGAVGLGLLLIVLEVLVGKTQDLIFVVADKQSDGVAILLYLLALVLGIGWWVWMYKLAKKAPTILLPKETLKGWKVIAEFDTKAEAKAYVQRKVYGSGSWQEEAAA